MQKRTKLFAGATVAVLACGVGTALAAAGGEDEAEGPETPISGADLDAAGRAALEFTGGGEITDTEVGDEESLYEVEVTLDGGQHVDVQLDENFNVVGSETDAVDDPDD